MAEDKKYDVVVIGAGPGGYVAAIRAAQLGMRVAIVDKRAELGGTCLNIGCIPSKALLDSSELYAKASHDFADHGIGVGTPTLDLAAMMKRKDGVVSRMTGGVSMLMKKNKVAVYHGIGRLARQGVVVVSPPDAVEGDAGKNGGGRNGAERLVADHIILASGSVPAELPFLPFDRTRVVSSTEALDFDSIPERLVIVGAGAIGLELGSVWARLGSKVQVVEIMDEILPGWDEQAARTLRRELTKQGFSFALSTTVTGADTSGKTVVLKARGPKGDDLSFEADRILVAVGRKAYFEGLGTKDVGIETTQDGRRIKVDEAYRTSVAGVYAIGDLIHGPMLAHKAEDEGVAVAEIIAGKPGHVNYATIPGIVYTWPEAACVGLTEKQCKDEGIPYRTGVCPFGAVGRAVAMGYAGGMVKIIAHEESDKVLGAHIVGPWASDLIAEVVSVMEFSGSAEDIARTVHGHPTLTEAVKEAALAVDKRSINTA